MEENDYLSAEQENYYESPDQCQYCHQRTADKSENPNSILCRECREKLVKFPIPKGIYAAVAVILIMMIVALTQFPASMQAYKIYGRAEAEAQDGYIYSTLDKMCTLAETYPDSIEIPIKIVEIGAEYGYYDFAGYAVDTFLAGKELRDSQYNRVQKFMPQIERYYMTYNAFDALVQSEEAKGENAVAYIQGELTKLLEDKSYDEALLCYYLGYTVGEAEKAIEYLEKSYALDPTIADAAAQLGISYRRKGDMQKAREFSEKAYNTDKENITGMRGLAVLELLEDNKADGLELAQEAYTLYPYGDYVVDTYIVALKENNQLEKAIQIKEEWQSKEGYTFDVELEAFLEEKISLKDYYIGE